MLWTVHLNARKQWRRPDEDRSVWPFIVPLDLRHLAVAGLRQTARSLVWASDRQ